MSYNSKNVRANVCHKIYMALLTEERRSQPGMALSQQQSEGISLDTETITDLIEQEYSSKGGAGALWLDRMLKDLNWLAQIQEKAWAVQKEKKAAAKNWLWSQQGWATEAQAKAVATRLRVENYVVEPGYENKAWRLKVRIDTIPESTRQAPHAVLWDAIKKAEGKSR